MTSAEPLARPAAGPEDVLAGIAVRHEAYGRAATALVEYQARRLASRREHRAVPWVLDRGDGTIVATLLCYPLDLALDGRRFPAYGLGSVGTRVAERRRGYAAALCRAACAASEAEGRAVGLLYSDIPAAYYERLGFRALPAWDHRCDRLRDFAASGDALDLVPVDPRREADRLCEAWRAHHRGRLHPHRDRARFLESVEDGSDDWFVAARGRDAGYARLFPARDGSLDLLEAIVLDPADEAPMLRAVAGIALAASRTALTSWLEPSPAVDGWFTSLGRESRGLPMLRGGPRDAPARFWASDHF